MTAEILLYRDRLAGIWCRSDLGNDGTRYDSRTSYSSSEYAADVVVAIRKANPGAKIGVRATDIGAIIAHQNFLRGHGETLWIP